MGEIKQTLHVRKNSPSQSTRTETHPSVHGLTLLIKQSFHLQSASPVPQGKPIKHLSKQDWELKFITPLGSKKPTDSVEILDFRHTMRLSHINPSMCHNISSTRLSPSLRRQPYHLLLPSSTSLVRKKQLLWA